MQRLSRFLLTGLLLGMGCLLTQAQGLDLSNSEGYTFRIEPRVWFGLGSEMDGDYEDSANNAEVSLDHDFDDEVRVNPFIEFQFHDRHKIRFSYFRVDESDAVTGADVDVDINGIPAPQPAGSRAKGSVDLDVFELGYQYDVFEDSWGFVGALLDVAIVSYEIEGVATYETNGGGNGGGGNGAEAFANSGRHGLQQNGGVFVRASEDEDGVVPIPQIGINARVYLHERIALCAEVKGMTVGSAGSLFQVFGGPELQINDSFAVSAGYRYLRFDVDAGDFNVEFEDHGPYVGAVIRF